MNFLNDLASEFLTFRHKLDFHQVRSLVILTGDKFWQEKVLASLEPNSGIWVGENSMLPNLSAVEIGKLRQLLGQEIDTAVFSAEEGISADSLAIVAGMLKAGGILWILLPNREGFANPANQRFLSYPFELASAKTGFEDYLLANLADAIWLEQAKIEAGKLPEFCVGNLARAEQRQELIGFGLTADQQQALDLLLDYSLSLSDFQLLIEADRGRGKSSLLGIAAAKLVLQGKKVFITAARFEQAKIAFKHCLRELQTAQPDLVVAKNNSILLADVGLFFKAPDDLILNEHSCDLLLVDEAAHLPLPMLEKIIAKYPRVLFASTLQGYEGSGQGFNLRLKKILRETAKFAEMRLQTPVRWAENDPLEELINNLLLLNLELPSLKNLAKTQLAAELQIEQVAIESLSKNQLRQVFALLQQAHYQSTPADLQHLLSAPDLQLFLASVQPDLVGVLLVCDEGNLPVFPSNRRVKGHLVPQLLRMQTGDTAYVTQQSQRALRIAVHPEVRRLKIASKLVAFWQETALKNGKDFISVSFGDTAELTEFWQKLGFESKHLGKKQNKASGRFNRVMTKSNLSMRVCVG